MHVFQPNNPHTPLLADSTLLEKLFMEKATYFRDRSLSSGMANDQLALAELLSEGYQAGEGGLYEQEIFENLTLAANQGHPEALLRLQIIDQERPLKVTCASTLPPPNSEGESK